MLPGMADFHSTGWVAGETVTAGAISRTPPGTTGSTADTQVAGTTGAVDFSGLAEETDYRATGGTSGRSVRFRTGVVQSGGGGGGGGGNVAAVIYDDGWAPRPDADLTIYTGGDVSTPPSVGGETGARHQVDQWVGWTGEGA